MLTFRKDAVKWLTLRKVAQNRKSCSKVAEQNLSRPSWGGGGGEGGPKGVTTQAFTDNMQPFSPDL